MTATSTRGPYAKTRRVRQEIIEAAVEVFAESGYRATTMKEIAARAGISEGGLVHHFPNKDELLSQVLDRHEQRAATHIPKGSSGIAALQALVDIMEQDSRDPGIAELHSMLAAEATNPDHPAHEHYRSRYENVRRFATRCFELLEEEGRIKSPLTAGQLGASFVALLDGLQLQWLYAPESVTPAPTLRAFLNSAVHEAPDAGAQETQA